MRMPAQGWLGCFLFVSCDPGKRVTLKIAGSGRPENQEGKSSWSLASGGKEGRLVVGKPRSAMKASVFTVKPKKVRSFLREKGPDRKLEEATRWTETPVTQGRKDTC